MFKINYLDDHGRNEDTESAATHRLIHGFKSVGAVDYRRFTTMMSRSIDTGPCEPLRAEDADWGERDEGQRPSAPKLPMSFRLVLNPGLVPEGDR
jgi:hypothetical protein